jgi:hypothetical protein
MTGYYPNIGINSCIQCTGTGNWIYSESDGNCIICPDYCESCDTSVCYYCSKGYILSQDQLSCIQGGSLLCKQSSGIGYINCKVDITGC